VSPAAASPILLSMDSSQMYDLLRAKTNSSLSRPRLGSAVRRVGTDFD
jgi:hypothetical protein